MMYAMIHAFVQQHDKTKTFDIEVPAFLSSYYKAC